MEIQQRALNNAITEAQNQEISKELDAEMNKIQTKSAQVQTMLKSIDTETKRLQKSSPKNSEIPIRIAQVLNYWWAWCYDYKLCGRNAKVQDSSRIIPSKIKGKND